VWLNELLASREAAGGIHAGPIRTGRNLNNMVQRQRRGPGRGWL